MAVKCKKTKQTNKHHSYGNMYKSATRLTDNLKIVHCALRTYMKKKTTNMSLMMLSV